MKIEVKPETDERRVRQLHRKRVAIFLFCVVLTVVVLSTVFDALQTWNRLEWVERQRDQWQRPGDVIQELNLKPGSVAVDLGCGVGYFALKLSNTVGRTGKVFAVDILKFPLQVLRVRTLLSRQHNVDAILGEPDNPHLTAGSVDAVLIANTFHEIAHPSEVLDHLTVGPESSVAPETEARRQRILYATDFSAESEPAMHFARRLAQEYGAALFFLHVVEDVWKESISTRVDADDFFRLSLLQKHWMLKPEGGPTPEFHVDFGPPAECVLEIAGELRIELIVLAVRGTRHSRVAAHLPGPTTYDVVSHARCPVLAIRGGPSLGK